MNSRTSAAILRLAPLLEHIPHAANVDTFCLAGLKRRNHLTRCRGQYNIVKSTADSTASELRPVSIGEVERLIASRATQPGSQLKVAGGRTTFAGLAVHERSAETLVLTGLNRVVDYPARDMTITVEAGLRVADLQQRLLEQGQTLPIDMAEPHRATIGGAIASNASGPGRFGYGTFRDYLIGVRAVDGRGRLFAAGGRVVKNVAGYDLCKLLVGSQGRLAAIVEVTLKLRPIPESRRVLWLPLADWNQAEAALERLVSTATRPVAVELLTPLAAQHMTRDAKLDLPHSQPVLCLVFDGARRETDWQAQTVTHEFRPLTSSPSELDAESGQALWTSLTEYQTASDDPLTFRAGLRPSGVVAVLQTASNHQIAAQAHAASGVIVGHFPDSCANPAAVSQLLNVLQTPVVAAAGRLSILRCDPEWRPQLPTPLQLPQAEIERSIKATLDPHCLFV
ncbi:MAG: FAD-binding oxidoreductase [Planctomycetaceae bacterium]